MAFLFVLISFVYVMAVANPAWLDVSRALSRTKEVFTNP
jgi:hypothetical protein